MTAPMTPRSPLAGAGVIAPLVAGRRHEFVDGSLIVTPLPQRVHQRAAHGLARVLEGAVPPDLEVLHAPFEWFVDDSTQLQPDVMVVRKSDPNHNTLRVPPVVAVEITSPSTRLIDFGTKKLTIANAGTPHYWIVDPDEPSVVAFDLVDHEFVEVGRAVGEETMTLESPFPVEVVPARLLA